MSIRFRCHTCGKKFEVKDQFRNKRMKCQGCGTILRVPRESLPEKLMGEATKRYLADARRLPTQLPSDPDETAVGADRPADLDKTPLPPSIHAPTPLPTPHPAGRPVETPIAPTSSEEATDVSDKAAPVAGESSDAGYDSDDAPPAWPAPPGQETRQVKKPAADESAFTLEEVAKSVAAADAGDTAVQAREEAEATADDDATDPNLPAHAVEETAPGSPLFDDETDVTQPALDPSAFAAATEEHEDDEHEYEDEYEVDEEPAIAAPTKPSGGGSGGTILFVIILLLIGGTAAAYLTGTLDSLLGKAAQPDANTATVHNGIAPPTQPGTPTENANQPEDNTATPTQTDDTAEPPMEAPEDPPVVEPPPEEDPAALERARLEQEAADLLAAAEAVADDDAAAMQTQLDEFIAAHPEFAETLAPGQAHVTEVLERLAAEAAAAAIAARVEELLTEAAAATFHTATAIIDAITAFLADNPEHTDTFAAELERLALLATRPDIAGMTWLREETFTAGGVTQVVQVYQHDALMQASGLPVMWLGAQAEFVLIPAGTFQMGAPEGEAGSGDQERPVHAVDVPAFLMGRVEVTQTIFNGAVTANELSDIQVTPSATGGSLPLDAITWTDASAFATALGMRLPSEAEWEYAARAGTTTAWFTGDDAAGLSTVAWHNANAGEAMHDVGTAPGGANAFGLLDILGNAWEWVQDRPLQDYTAAPTDGSAVTDSPFRTYRVVRGGAFDASPTQCRSAFREVRTESSSNPGVGFRLVMDIP